MPFFGSGFDSTRVLKPNLKMACKRLAMLVNKKSNEIKIHRNSIKDMLAKKKYEKANIKVEHVIREERLIEAYETIELMCELMVERMALIKQDKYCPADLIQSVHTVLWAAPRTQVPEFTIITKQFQAKYGEGFVKKARSNAEGHVNEQIIARFGIEPPSPTARTEYMKQLCAEAGLAWDDAMVSTSTIGVSFSSGGAGGGSADAKRAATDAAPVPELPQFPGFNNGGGGAGGGAGSGTGGLGLPAAPMGAPGSTPSLPVYRTGDAANGAAGPWQAGMPVAGAYGGPAGPGGAPAGYPAGPGGAPAGYGMPPGGPGYPVGQFPAPPGSAAYPPASAGYPIQPGYPATTMPMMPTPGQGPAGMAPGSAAAAPGRTAVAAAAAGRAAFTAATAPAPAPYVPPPTFTPPPSGGGGGGPSGGLGLPAAPTGSPTAGGARAPAPSAIPDYDALTARFAALRNS